MASMSVSGIVSGMDWESMIDEIITNAAKPAQPQVSKKTNLTNKKSLFEEMKVTMNSLQSSLSPLKLPSTYKAKEIEIERLDNAGYSYKSVLTATVNADAEVNVWEVKVNQLATAQTNRSKQITDSTLASTLSGVTGSTFYINAGGQKIGIEVKSDDTLQSLKSRINTTLKTLDNPIHVTASVVDNKLILKSDYTGLGTFNAEETINYSSTGVNKLSSFSVNDDERENVTIMNGSTKYTHGTDFEIANGNEIRWKQYDRSPEVALGDTVNVKYTMAAGDKYESKGTYGTDEVEISGLGLTYNGTLASRAKIVDDEGNEYVYGKDFKIEDNKIVWIEAPEVGDSPKYNEPDAYTVSLTKNIPVSITKTYTKDTATNEPSSYTVSYDKTANGSYNITGTKISPVQIPVSYTVSYDKSFSRTIPQSTSNYATTAGFQISQTGVFPTFNELTSSEYNVNTMAGYPNILEFSGDNKIEMLNADGTSTNFTYGSSGGDYWIRRTGSDGTSPNATLQWRNAANKPANGFTVRFTHTYEATEGTSSFSSDVADIVNAAGTDTVNIVVKGSDGTIYEQGTHYDIENGQIVWKIQSEVTDLTEDQFANLKAQYKEGTGSDLATKTLIDGNSVIRTYVDPEAASLFTMNAGGKYYVYGRDYVLRVNDSGSGYRFDWLVDDSNTITDANTSVSTYAAYRNISTQTWQKAPADNTSYTFDFAGSHETTITADVTSAQADKTLSGILGETVTDTSKVSITDASGNVRTDYTISSDTITWSGTKPADDDKFNDIDALQQAFLNTTGSSSIPLVTLTDSDGVLRTYLDLSDSAVDFQIADASGKAYEYGRDYVIRVSDGGDGYVISWAVTGDSNNDGNTDVRDFNPVVAAYAAEKDINTYNLRQAPTSGKFTFSTSSTKTISHSGNVKATQTDKSLSHVFNTSSLSSADYSSVSIPGYTQGKDYVIDSTGTIRWLNQNSKTPEAYKATYKFSDNASVTMSVPTLNGNGINTISGVMSIEDTGANTFTYNSYTYIDEAEGKAMFTLIDGSGNTYEYGKDYAVRFSTTSTGTKKLTVVSAKPGHYWPPTFTNGDSSTTMPKTDLKLTYNNTVTRFVDSTESLSAGLGFTPSDRSNLTLTDVYGNKYTEDTDYTIDASGNVSWVEQDTDAPASYTVKYTAAQGDYVRNTSLNYDTLTSSRGFPNIDGISGYGFALWGTNPSNSARNELMVDVYDPSSTDDYKFVISTSDDGVNYSEAVQYVYGRDYVVRKSLYETDSTRTPLITWPPRREIGTYTNHVAATYPAVDLSGTTQTPPAGNYRVSIARTESNADTASVASLISDANGHYENITLTGSNGRTYTYVSNTADLDYSNFTIVNGEIMFKPSDTAKHPREGVGYTFYYDAFAVEATGTYTTGTTSQEVAINISDDAGKIGGDKVSYEQILSFASVSSTADQTTTDNSLGKFFTLTDTSGKNYVYGTDYRVIQGSGTDADTSEHTTAIEWISGGQPPTSNFTLTMGGNEVIETKGVTRSLTDTITNAPLASDLKSGTNTITYGGKTYYEGYDFNIGDDGTGNATIKWIKDSEGGYEWYYPTSGSRYTINHTDDDGNTTSYNASRTSSDTLDMSTYGMTTANGSISVQYGDDPFGYTLNTPTQYDENGNEIPNSDGNSAIKAAYSIDVTKTTDTAGKTAFNFRWVSPTQTSRTNLPTYGTELTVQYEYDANTFDLADDGDGDLLRALGFTKSDGTYDDYTAAQDAELEVDGQKMYRASNDIGADYDNELIKGVTMHLKGVGTVSLDISHDAQKAVESIQTFVDNYNDLMTWMNTRMTEKQVDEDTAATIDSDDFRMRWGLLHGNSLLRQTKTQMRSLTSQNFTFSFTQRKSSEEIYGSMAFNGLKTSSTLRLRIGSKYVDVTIDPTDTLETIVAKINDDTKNGPMHSIYYDDDGNRLPTPLLKASVENDILVINSTSSDEITMSGSAAMNALKMNYTYKGLYQIGIESTSDDYGKSGELVFDSNEFMEALEDNPDEVQALMMKFVSQFDTWTKGMLNSSASGETSGTLTREIENIQSQIDNINDYLERYQERLDRMEENLRTRYGNTETQFAKLSQQANSIAAILNQLNGTASGGGYGQASS